MDSPSVGICHSLSGLIQQLEETMSDSNYGVDLAKNVFSIHGVDGHGMVSMLCSATCL